MDTLYKVLWKEHSEDGTSISYVSCDEIESSLMQSNVEIKIINEPASRNLSTAHKSRLTKA
jgi:hypothetical protein